jgi:hypothetical protein
MKNDKRDITLNQADSIQDMMFMQKMLLRNYCEAIFFARRKEVRSALLECFASVAEDVFFLEGLSDGTNSGAFLGKNKK